MSEHLNDFSNEIFKSRVVNLLKTTQEKTEKLGIKTLVIGSFGIAGLTGKYPKLFRGMNPKNGCFQCVDIDILLGLPEGIDLKEVKSCFDELWFTGMNSQYQIPVSPVNLPKAVANNPREVLDFQWTLGREIKGRSIYGIEYKLPPEFVAPFPIKIYDQETQTLNPRSQIIFKLLPGFRSPQRILKDSFQIYNVLSSPV